MINRRDFLKRSSKGTAGFAMGGFLTRAYGRADALGPLAASAVPETDRILVIIRLAGGNDGLNTLVQFENDAYYQARPTLNIPKSDVLKIDDNIGLNPELPGFHELFKEGQMMGVQGVGYPNPNRSHFRSTDIWMTASDSNEYITNGWLGRYMELANPDFLENLPEHPLAVDIGPVLSLALLGKNTAMGIALRNPNQFFNLVNQGNKIIDDNKILTPAGYELDFIRRVNFESLQYSSQVREAANNGENKATYPDTTLASQLSLIARLISGGLNTRVFLVRQGGYDTHANQINRHTDLLQELDGAVLAFQRDLQALSLQDKVMGMTVSEFGRRTKENGSVGTDHGTSAPLFMFGANVAGGVYGNNPDFETLDSRGDFFHEYHFRQVYASVLSQWFGVPNDILNAVFPSRPSMLSLIQTGASREQADFTGDGKVDFSDFLEFARAFGGTDTRFDLDGSGGKIDFGDFLAFARAFGK